MTTQEIQQYMESAISTACEDYTSESFEMMTSEGGDGRFFGKVVATRYAGLGAGQDCFLAIGQTEKGGQIVKFGNTELLAPTEADLDMALRKELGLGA